MKITSIDLFILKSALTDSPYPSKPVVCRINTDEGIYGFGEAGIYTGLGEHGVFGMLQDLAPLAIGKDPMDNEVIWEDIRTRLHGHCSGAGVAVFSALSALDIAMMDIKGRAFGVPCYKLLGGLHNAKLPCYASHIQNGWGTDIAPRGSAEEYAEIAHRVQEAGYPAAKFDFIAFDRDKRPLSRTETAHQLYKQDLLNMVEERLQAIRARCGDHFGIIMENLCRLDISTSIDMDDLAVKYGVLFMEECLDPFKVSNYKVLAEKTRTPLAAGEKVHTRWGFSNYFESNCLRVIQPDVTNCGGLSEAKKICDMAHVYDMKVQTHVCGTPLSLAAAIQLEAAIPNFSIHEYFYPGLHPEIVNYCKHDHQPVNGVITVPDLPGLGNELSEQAMKEAPVHLLIK